MTRAIALVAILLSALGAGLQSSVGRAWNAPSAPVTLRSVFSYWMSDPDLTNNMQGPIYYNDCAVFSNNSTHSVQSVELVFASASANGDSYADHAGPPLPLDITTPLKPGGIFDKLSCRVHGFANGAGGRWLIGWIRWVAFDDGSLWYAIPPIPGSVAVSNGSLQILSTYMTAVPSECVNIRNAGTSAIRNPQISFAHLGSNGDVLGTDILTVKRTLGTGESATGICRGFSGEVKPDEYTYMLEEQSGLNPAAPAVFYNGQPSRIRASVVKG